MKKINVGIIGFGTIGSAVVNVLKERRSFLRQKSGIDINIARICDKDIKAKRPVKVGKGILTNSIAKVLYDDKIDIVVESIGGIIPAKQIILESLRQGRHVVTANKALLSEAGSEIFTLAGKLGLCVGFEASVGGGIPVIRALKEGFVADRIELIYGIVNGTSNFILSKMAEESLSFKEALKVAQEMGCAERDPRLDVSGVDSRHKLAILAHLGFGIDVKPGQIYTEGIERIESLDIQFAKESGYCIKLLAIAKKSTLGSVELRVHPTLISKSHVLASVNGVYNAIFVKGDLVGDNLFYGRGAGPGPTSSAVTSDIVAIAAKLSEGPKQISSCSKMSGEAASVKNMEALSAKYYIRFSAIDKPGVLTRISGILAKHKISIASVTQKARKAAKVVPIVMLTHDASERDMARALKEIDALSMIRKKSIRIRIEE